MKMIMMMIMIMIIIMILIKMMIKMMVMMIMMMITMMLTMLMIYMFELFYTGLNNFIPSKGVSYLMILALSEESTTYSREDNLPGPNLEYEQTCPFYNKLQVQLIFF